MLSARDPLLLIGGAGLVGSHIRAAWRGRELVATFHDAPVAGGIALDLLDESAVRATVEHIHPDTVILAAADPWVEHCELDPTATRRLNVEAARVVADEVRRIGALLVVFSSEYVFDGTKGRYTEEDAVHPINEYGRQKVALEAIARAVPRHLVCRTSGVFGAEDGEKNFVCQLLRALRAGSAFPVPSDQLITPTYAPTLAQAVTQLVDIDMVGTVHVVGPRAISRVAFAQMACDVFRLDQRLIAATPTDDLRLAAPRPRRAGLADKRLRAILRHPLADPEEGLRQMCQVLESQSKGISGLS